MRYAGRKGIIALVIGSLVAGFIFTFSNYHFSHAEGHLQLTSLEWIPLFILCWHVLMTKPSVRMGIFSALALFGVILCDYYYFLYSVVTAMFIYAWKALREHDFLFALRRGRRGALAAFAAGTVGMSGSLIVPLLLLNRRDPLQGSHRPELFSLDLLAPLIPGGHWRFAAWTEGYWSKLPGNIHESSVHLGLSLILALALIWIGRRKVGTEGLALWYVLLIAFMILSLGPTLNIWGKTIPGIKLPYSWLESVFPPLRLGGTPVRMMVVPLLAAAVIFALGFRDVLVSTKGRRVMTACLLIMMGFEYLPKPMPRTRIEVPAYVYALRKLDGAGGVLDLASPTLDMMYFQTIHGKPLAFGYLARLPASVDELNGRIAGLVRSGEFGLLARRDRFRWLVAPGWPPRSTDTGALMVVFDDGNVRIYEIRG